MTAEDVERANTEFYRAFEQADVDAMARVWDDEQPGQLTCIHPGWPPLRGRQQVLRSWSALMAGTDYLQFFLPGILVSSIAMITMYTGVGLNTDIEKGVFDRFRTLPVWRPAALVGMIFGDLLRYVIASAVILAVGLALGFRPEGGVLGVVGSIALLVVFSFAFSWVWTFFGLVLRSEKSVMGVSMMVLMPITFLSNVYVDPSTMPGWLQAFVKVNPITQLVDTIRGLMRGEIDGQALMWTLIASALFLVVFGSLTMRRYNRR